MIRWMVPPVAIAVELRQIQRLGHHALAGERRVAVDQERDHALALGVAEAVLLRAHDAFDHRIDRFEMARVGRHRDRRSRCPRSTCARRSRPGDTSRRPSPACSVGSMSPSNSEKICVNGLPTMFASTLRRPRCAMPMTISCTLLSARAVEQSRPGSRCGLGAFERETLLADEARVQEVLELLGLDQVVAECATRVS